MAERLGVEFLDRKVPEDVARQTGLSEKDVGDIDQRPRGRLERVSEALARAANFTDDAAGSDERPALQERQLRGYIEATLARLSASGGVVVGRGGMVVVAEDRARIRYVAASRARTRQAGTARTDPKPEART